MINSISWKNIWRNKIRSLVVISAVTFGILAAVFSAALMNGMVDRRVKTAIEIETSHIQMHNPDYMENKDLVSYINNADSCIEQIKKLKEVKAVCKRMKIIAMANTSSSGTGVMVYGVEPEKEKQVSGLYSKIPDTCGTYLEGIKTNPVVISAKLAEKLKLKLKSKLILTFQTCEGSLISAAFKVSGIYKTSNSMFDEMNIFVKLDDLAGLTNFNKNNTHEIAILLYDTQNSDITTSKLSGLFKNYDFITWKEIQPDLGITVEFLNIMLYFSLIIILLALGFGIVNTMLMVVLERMKELGMLMAVGMNKVRIFKMIMLETIYLSLTGGITGLILGVVLITVFSHSGIDLSSYGEGFNAIGYDTMVYPSIGMEFYIGTVALVVLTGIIASIYPARKALKLKPAEAVKTDL